MIRISSRGSTQKTEAYLNRLKNLRIDRILHAHGKEGVAALAAATPKESGVAAASWGYEIRNERNSVSIVWTNSNVENGFPVAIMLQYGYATGTGGYVAGRNYINPAIQPVMDRIADKVWREVTAA